MASNELEVRGENHASDHGGAATAPGKRTLSGAIQRRAAASTSVAPTVQRRAASRVSDALDPFGLHVQRRGDGDATSDEVHAAAAHGISGASSALPHADAIQHSFGRHDVSGISAHTDGAAADGARAMGAEAFATGTHVAFGGPPSLHTAAHEAAHVVQQRAGVHLAGGVGAVGDVYERHADEVADAVVAGRSAEALLDRHAGTGGGTGVQCRKPGDAPPKLEDQLEDRLQTRGETTALPTEQELVAALDLTLQVVFPPTTHNTAQELVEQGLADYFAHNNFGTSRDLITQSAILNGLVMGAWVQYDPQGNIPFQSIAQALQARMQPEIRQAVATWCNQHQHPVPSNGAIDRTFHYDVHGVGNGPPAKAEAKRFLVDHPMTQGFTGTLQQNDKLALIGALKKMPTVQRALTVPWFYEDNPTSVQGVKRGEQSQDAAAWIRPKIEVDDGSERGLGEDEDDRLIAEKNVPSGCVENIHEAMRRICGLVEPGRLALAGQPVIFVHLVKDRTLLERLQNGDFSQAQKMRAYSESYEKAIHVDYRDPIATIVHEVGHQLENQLPTELWLDIHRMLRGRHDQSVQQDNKDELESIYPNHKDKNVRKEPRFRATMPGTGPYSAKSYDGPGSTEVLSMSMEYLCEPSTAKTLIENDPLQAAIVLRGIAPNEFTMFVPQNLWALLPS